MELPKVLGRAAVPVRLIPHLAPCLSAEELALILARQDPRCKWDLSAHWLRQDGTVGEMHPDEWHGVALEIGLLPAQPGVILQTTMSLPEGVFVWRDELESEYPKFIGEDGAYSPSVTNGSEDYEGSGALSFERRPPPHSELIYAGFDHALADWPRIARGAELHADAKELDTTAPSDRAPVQAAVQGPSDSAAEPAQVAKETLKADRGLRVKRNALIERNRRRWPSIERDLKDASSNGLSAEARADGTGFWWEGDALKWAEARDKLEAPTATVGLASVVHRMAG